MGRNAKISTVWEVEEEKQSEGYYVTWTLTTSFEEFKLIKIPKGLSI